MRRSVVLGRSDSAKLEEQTRQHGHFSDTESSLASASTYQTQASRKQHKITHLLSYLGSSNPLPAPISADDVVWLMDNIAFRGRGGEWMAECVACAFDHRPSPKVVDIVGDIASKVGLSKGDREERTIERRIAPFVMEILPGRQIKVKFNRKGQLKLGPGGRNGISSDLKSLPKAHGGTVVTSTADVPMGVVGMLEMKTMYAEPEGWAVISGTATQSTQFGLQFTDRLDFLCRHRRHHQNHTNKRPSWHLEVNFCERAHTSARHAGTVLAYPGFGDTVGTLLLSFSIPLQPVFLSPRLSGPILSVRPAGSSRLELADCLRPLIQPDTRDREVQDR
jgi:hypothetical protein